MPYALFEARGAFRHRTPVGSRSDMSDGHRITIFRSRYTPFVRSNDVFSSYMGFGSLHPALFCVCRMAYLRESRPCTTLVSARAERLFMSAGAASFPRELRTPPRSVSAGPLRKSRSDRSARPLPRRRRARRSVGKRRRRRIASPAIPCRSRGSLARPPPRTPNHRHAAFRWMPATSRRCRLPPRARPIRTGNLNSGPSTE